ncbi:uncharacterized protein LOC121382057 [Gigantopelta aegis]|uniref:uncharacterized protein LOC121382057 n=1 Tax=Gigantopelta aegis TaxID=1735272 RepID=UPI001B88C65C|nr:uncharacterized protein LOC121382057 [Gigantopelta aegis]
MSTQVMSNYSENLHTLTEASTSSSEATLTICLVLLAIVTVAIVGVVLWYRKYKQRKSIFPNCLRTIYHRVFHPGSRLKESLDNLAFEGDEFAVDAACVECDTPYSPVIFRKEQSVQWCKPGSSADAPVCEAAEHKVESVLSEPRSRVHFTVAGECLHQEKTTPKSYTRRLTGHPTSTKLSMHCSSVRGTTECKLDEENTDSKSSVSCSPVADCPPCDLSKKEDSVLSEDATAENYLHNKKRNSSLSLYSSFKEAIAESGLFRKTGASSQAANVGYDKNENPDSIFSLHCSTGAVNASFGLNQNDNDSTISLHCSTEVADQKNRDSIITLNCPVEAATVGYELKLTETDSRLSVDCSSEEVATARRELAEDHRESTKRCSSWEKNHLWNILDSSESASDSERDSIYTNINELETMPLEKAEEKESRVLHVSELSHTESCRLGQVRKVRSKSMDDGINALSDDDDDDDDDDNYMSPTEMERWPIDDTYLYLQIIPEEPMDIMQPGFRTLPAQIDGHTPESSLGTQSKITAGNVKKRASEPGDYRPWAWSKMKRQVTSKTKNKDKFGRNTMSEKPTTEVTAMKQHEQVYANLSLK